MQEFLEYLIKTVVKDQSAVKVEMTEDDERINFKVTVASSDLGKVIGKGGKMANAIRTLISTINNEQHKKVYVRFGD